MMQPKHTTITTWAASLFIDFPDDDIPRLTDIERWKDWGNLLIQCDSFAINGAASPTSYSKWNAWADDVYKAMENT